jgi:hypothetical protein
MPTPFESGLLNLQLFDLRREPVLREARACFLNDFNPETLSELVAIVSGERNASFRMVLGYWDMAASLVTTGAIDGDAFRAAHGEVFATFSKVQTFLTEMRRASGEPRFLPASRGRRHGRAERRGDPEPAPTSGPRRGKGSANGGC